MVHRQNYCISCAQLTHLPKQTGYQLLSSKWYKCLNGTKQQAEIPEAFLSFEIIIIMNKEMRFACMGVSLKE